MIGAAGSGGPGRIGATLDADPSGRRVLKALAAAGFDIARADAVRLFAEGSRAGARVTLTAETGGLLIACAPGGPMAPHEQTPPTEILLYIRRATLTNVKGGLAPPDPLADPLSDTNIRPGEAVGYEVRRGQYIQILDVQGRECSDFQALSLGALDRGLERDIDPTTTRSLMGLTYPAPGLLSKYWTVDQEPLVEIVQDTCGRHDSFGLSCSARYYEDLGYPGHVNCSDNITRELSKWNVRPRTGWPAINFFFNTMLDEHHVLHLDDPWSRPGDYVLLRALTDLVCVSSACPSDIDASNGWNPTDIQVRVYDAAEDFQPSRGYRMTADSPVEPTKKTGFHACFARHTRDFVEYNGYWLPNQMTNHGAIAEYWACREKAVVMDLSPLRKFEVLGPDAEALLQLCLTRNVKKLSVGQVAYSAVCYDHGGMMDDGTVFRLGDNNFRWIGGSDLSGLWLREQAEARGLDVHVKTATDQLCNIAVQGPASRAILEPVVWTAPTPAERDGDGGVPLRAGAHRRLCRPADRAQPHRLYRRAGVRGVLPPRDAEAVFDAIWQAGAAHGLAPCGLAALDMLRIEAGLVFAGFEFSRPDRPLRGRHRLHRAAQVEGGRFHRPRRAGTAQGQPDAPSRRARHRGGRRARAWRLRPTRPRADRRDHLGDSLAYPRPGDRARPARRDPCRDRHRGRDRPARRSAETAAGPGRALPAFRPEKGAREGQLCLMPALCAPYRRRAPAGPARAGPGPKRYKLACLLDQHWFS